MMLLVVDANFSLAQVLPLPYSMDVFRRIRMWQVELPRIIVPSLWEYEIVTGLRRAYVQGLLYMDEAQVVLNELLEMSLEVIPTSARLHQRALDWAERLGQSRAYDSQYVALAEQMGANLWTGDRRLANSSASLGLDWVHWVGED